MGRGPAAEDYPGQYFCASAVAAAVNFPLWRVSAMGQSGFVVQNMQMAGMRVPNMVAPYLYAFLPPYKGAASTVFCMTWARAAIFWGSDAGRDRLRAAGYSESAAIAVPPLLVSTFVQFVNMPIVRATVTIQDPTSPYKNVWVALKHLYSDYGVAGLWHGTSAGVLKTVPKYITAVVVKDFMDEWLTPADPTSPHYDRDRLVRSAYKSMAAGIAGAVLTNPLDVIRNEMFKTNYTLTNTVRHLWHELGYGFLSRGMGKNTVAVALPVACTIFFTDALIQWSTS